MPTEITDEAGVVSGSLRKIKLGGQSFRVPTSPTIRYLFWMRAFLRKFSETGLTDDDIVECYEETVAFLRRYNPDVDERALQDSCELTELIAFYNRCYGADADSGGEDDDERPPRAAAGTASSARSRTARSRS